MCFVKDWKPIQDAFLSVTQQILTILPPHDPEWNEFQFLTQSVAQ